jgi:hypothetical protein
MKLIPLIKLKAVTIKKFHFQKRVTNFVFLQIADGGTWSVVWYSNGTFDNNLDCISVKYDGPEGYRSLQTVEAFDKRWVHNIHSLFNIFTSENKHNV